MKHHILTKFLFILLFFGMSTMTAKAVFIVIFKGNTNKGTTSLFHIGNIYEKVVCKSSTGECIFSTGGQEAGTNFNLDKLIKMANGNAEELALVQMVQKLLDGGQLSGRIISSLPASEHGSLSLTLGNYTQQLLRAGEEKNWDFIEDFYSPIHFAVWNIRKTGDEYSAYFIIN